MRRALTNRGRIVRSIRTPGRRLGMGTLCALALATLAACATGPGAQHEADTDGENLVAYNPPNDPLEPANRLIFAFNRTLDTFIIKPVATTYDFWLPNEVKTIAQNFVRNARSPVILANDVLQREWTRAEDTLARFLVNTVTTAGLGDLVADRHPYHDEDFGQTLATYGVDGGPYLVLPLFGPANIRDAVGRGVDIAFDPATYIDGGTTFAVTTTAIEGVDARARRLGQIRRLKADSVDFYARIRSLYAQRRKAAIDNADTTPTRILRSRKTRETEPNENR